MVVSYCSYIVFSANIYDTLHSNTATETIEGVGKQGMPSRSVYDVPVVYFDALTVAVAGSINSKIDINSMSNSSTDTTVLQLLLHPAVLPLVRYLCSGAVDVLMVVNTFGDAQTTLLLDVVLLLRTLQQPVQQQQQTEQIQYYKLLFAEIGQPYSWHLPKIVMDLPNLGLPSKWHHKLDAFIAPSRFAGLSELTTVFGTVLIYTEYILLLVALTNICDTLYR